MFKVHIGHTSIKIFDISFSHLIHVRVDRNGLKQSHGSAERTSYFSV